MLVSARFFQLHTYPVILDPSLLVILRAIVVIVARLEIA